MVHRCHIFDNICKAPIYYLQEGEIEPPLNTSVYGDIKTTQTRWSHSLSLTQQSDSFKSTCRGASDLEITENI